MQEKNRTDKAKSYIPLLLMIVLVAFFYTNNTFYMIENPLLDRLVVEDRETHPALRILAIDEQSLEAIGRWPWSRDILAQVSAELIEGGARAVWLDVLYSEKSSHPIGDEAWAGVMARTEGIYHSAYMELKDKQAVNLPLQVERAYGPVFPVKENQVGLINNIPDKDGVVRQAILGIPDQEGKMIPAVDVLLANLLLPEEQQIRWDGSRWLRGNLPLAANAWSQVHFAYASTPGVQRFEVLPIAPVIQGELDPAYFEDAIVLIGPYALGISDDLFTTPGSQNVRMYGVEIHANIIQSLWDGELYRQATTGTGIGILFLLTVLAYFFMERLRAKWSVLVLAGLAVLYVMLHSIVFDTLNIVLPFFYPLLALFFTYITAVVLQYLRERKERGRITSIFGRYVSKGLVKEILENKEEIQLGGVRRDVTLVFVDIRGFTPLSEKMEPEDVILILNEYLDLCTRAVFAYEGTLDKFIGDGVMSIFGAPMEQPDHPARAIRAALQMKKESAQLADSLVEKYGRSVSFGIGINSGPAVVGNIGSKERLDYTAIGDTVNLAARLESNAKPGQILISQNTYERVQELFAVIPLDPIKVKGREQLVQVYQVEGESANSQHKCDDQEVKSLIRDND